MLSVISIFIVKNSEKQKKSEVKSEPKRKKERYEMDKKI
jgi:hypothetical protein